MNTKPEQKRIVIIGAGPAGLTAGYELMKAGVPSIVLEQDRMVGGLSRTVLYKGFRFDLGGHRFFTKVKGVSDVWTEVLGNDLLLRNRLSRIYYNGKYFFYPLRPMNALLGLGLKNSIEIVLSYIYAQFQLRKVEDNLEDWIAHRFGNRLYRTFFKTYTEKVWGVPCRDIKAEWAAQRIKGLSLTTAVLNALRHNGGGDRNHNGSIKTLIDQFHYPKHGPGMMWEAVARALEGTGCPVCLNSEVGGILWSDGKVEAVEITKDGHTDIIAGSDFISSMPLREAILKFKPSPPPEVVSAAEQLRYRDFLTVVLIINKPNLFPDNWIYIHDPGVKVGRIQNYTNWSPFMVPDQGKTCLGLEYFCFINDPLWNTSDEELIAMAKSEIQTLGLAEAIEVQDATVVKMGQAYPMYDHNYSKSLEVIKTFLSGIRNLQQVGRNGMHRYNNQDHSMMTGMLAAENVLGGTNDLWSVNTDSEYHEEVAAREDETRMRALRHAFGRMDKLAFASALGAITGALLLIITMIAVARPHIGRELWLLGQYFPGYRVSPAGALVGFAYGFIWSFLFGWTFAYMRNLMIGFYVYKARRKMVAITFGKLIDDIL